ncbi:hypothetical protein QA600_21130 [Natronococcus sp. A-GB1]|uniref:hypothetical protein n=1 Tax=Natronococcus sp. A-GB1 TaxID=3037648 RepID=UPI00241E280B|nr:hypothetical protein [Natronococcus sp. A-GB1]MDG5761830.1 hypothetical protein [Natronococcus sp. A-GB1]
MSTPTRTTETVSARSRTDLRPDYILVGIDTEGAHHVYRTTDETVHVIDGPERTYRYDLEALEQTIDDWINYVTTRRGFPTQHLYTGLADALADAIGGGEA